MAALNAYDYSTHNKVKLQCGMLNSNDVQGLQSGTYSTEFGDCAVTKTGAYIYMRVNGALGEVTNYTIVNVLADVGIRSNAPLFGNIVGKIPDGTSHNYGFNRDYTSRPYFSYKKETLGSFNQYTVTVVPVGETQASLSETDNYPCCVAYIFLPTNPDNTDGVLGILTAVAYENSAEIKIQYFPQSFVGDVYDPDPGDKGFRPTDDPTKNDWPGIGGRPSDDPQKTDPDYPSDTILQPGAPDESVASAIGSGFLTAYKMTPANLKELGKCLFSQTLTDALLNVLINPLDFIVSLAVFPCEPNVGAAVPIKLGRWECRSGSLTGALGFNANGFPLTNQFTNPVLDFGTLTIPENWGSFLDYTHTRVELYLPFIGTIDLDVSECMGGTVNVQYTVDFFTGMCVANVLCLRPITLASGKIIGTRPAQHSYQGNCAIQIPLSSESYGSMMGNLINSCTRLIGNPAAAPISMAEGVLNGLNVSVTTKGSIVANSGFCAVLNPYIRITRPVTAAPQSYQEVVGYPSYINTSLSYCTGFCQCEDINLSGITGATESELEEIRALCKDGIII